MSIQLDARAEDQRNLTGIAHLCYRWPMRQFKVRSKDGRGLGVFEAANVRDACVKAGAPDGAALDVTTLYKQRAADVEHTAPKPQRPTPEGPLAGEWAAPPPKAKPAAPEPKP